MARHARRRVGALCSCPLVGYEWIPKDPQLVNCKKCLDIIASHHPNKRVVKTGPTTWELREKEET